jgi:hypothetical protein
VSATGESGEVWSTITSQATMRLWTVHPRYLDPKGLVALWREALLGQKVLQGLTRGYTSHPQLSRFRSHPEPLAVIARYLEAVCDEADARGYRFDRRKINQVPPRLEIEETQGQLAFEWQHLLGKLKARAPCLYEAWSAVELPAAHPLFRVVEGGVANWERGWGKHVADDRSGREREA